MGYLEKNFILHERGEEGNLLPIEYPIPELGNKIILVLPTTRGELLEVLTEVRALEIVAEVGEECSAEEKEKLLAGVSKGRKKVWEEFIIKHIIKPVFTREDFDNAKRIRYKGKTLNLEIDILLEAIYSVSGIDTTPEEAEKELKKK